MDPRGFCRQTRLVIVAGKGGVGKTTVAAALARMAAGLGLATLVVDVQGKSGLAAAFGVADDLGYEERVLSPRGPAPHDTGEVRARTLTPDMALLDYLREHGLRRISKRLLRSGTIDVVSTAAPGMKDILVLGKVKQIEAEGTADLIVIDAPAAGHAVNFLLSPRSLIDAIRGGPIRSQARAVTELLTDPSRCQVVLVTLPEETPVNEVIETAYALEDRVGVDLGPVVVNGLYPALDGLDADPEAAGADHDVTLRPGEADSLRQAAAFRRSRRQLQDEQVARLAEALPLPQVHLPALFDADIGLAQVDRLAQAMAAGVAALEVVPR